MFASQYNGQQIVFGSSESFFGSCWKNYDMTGGKIGEKVYGIGEVINQHL